MWGGGGEGVAWCAHYKQVAILLCTCTIRHTYITTHTHTTQQTHATIHTNLQDWEASKQRQDQQLDSIERGLETLRGLGEAMGENLQSQQVLANEVEDKLDEVSKALRTNNMKLKGLVTKVGGVHTVGVHTGGCLDVHCASALHTVHPHCTPTLYTHTVHPHCTPTLPYPYSIPTLPHRSDRQKCLSLTSSCCVCYWDLHCTYTTW